MLLAKFSWARKTVDFVSTQFSVPEFIVGIVHAIKCAVKVVCSCSLVYREPFGVCAACVWC